VESADFLALAATLKAMRQATAASGTYLKGRDIEVLFWIAGGADTIEQLAQATGLSRLNVSRSTRFLRGRTVNLAPNRQRHSPFRLIDARQHPHKARIVQFFLIQPIPTTHFQ